MTAFLDEDFTGSGDIDGTTPSPIAPAGAAWFNFVGTLSASGGLVSTSSSTTDKSNLDLTGAVGPTNLILSFSLTTGASLSATAFESAFDLSVIVGGMTYTSHLYWDGSVFKLQFNSDAGAGTAFTVSLATSTTYNGTMTLTSSAQNLSFLGQSIAKTVAYLDASEVSYLEIGAINNFKFGPLAIDPLTYGAAFFLPHITSVGYGGATGALTLPHATLSATGTGEALPSEHASAAMNLPQLVVAGYGNYTGAIVLPSLTTAGGTGAVGSVSLPFVRLDANGHDSTGENAADILLPSIQASALGGANVSLVLGSLEVEGSGSVTMVGKGAPTLPALSVTSSGSVGAVAQAALALPMTLVSGNFGGVLSVTLNGLEATATGTTGNVGRAQVELPLFEMDASGTVNGLNSAAITLPALAASPSGRADLILPGFTLTAIGHAVVTATYEAYAINLKHVPVRGVESVDEVTRYTSFPFTHIVRYKNSYYGVGSDGNLYLLEGTTDNTAPISWAWKTALDDFKTPNKKTLYSVNFSGRVGPAATITAYLGESGSNAYSYTTPRDALPQNYRQLFGKGMKDRYYALGATGDGDLMLDDMTPNHAVLARKI